MTDKVAVALSGGVDSAYAAWLLISGGYEVEGVCLDLFEGSAAPGEAGQIAETLGIKLHITDMKSYFAREVMDAFSNAYNRGRTPNPCVICNSAVKFSALKRAAVEMGADHIATGHYARLRFDEDSGKQTLLRAKDRRKDQSYFLYRLSQDDLRGAIFPLGELTKEEVRAGALTAGLDIARGRESQDICFIPDGDYQGFLKKHMFPNTGSDGFIPGDFVDSNGEILGRHKGYACYTIGQRKRLGVALGKTIYVLAVRPELNHVVLGPEEGLYRCDAKIEDCVFISGEAPEEALSLSVKLRSGAAFVPVVYRPKPGSAREGRLLFHQSQKSVTPGQSAVLYDGDRVIGGGIIGDNT